MERTRATRQCYCPSLRFGNSMLALRFSVPMFQESSGLFAASFTLSSSSAASSLEVAMKYSSKHPMLYHCDSVPSVPGAMGVHCFNITFVYRERPSQNT